MFSMSVYFGIDIGTSATKALAINSNGRVLAHAAAGYKVHHPRPLWSEQDPDQWWRATLDTVRAVMRRARLRAGDVKAIGLSGQMHGSVFLDRQGKVLRPAILWNDQRTAAECAEIEQRAGGKRKLISKVANPALTGFTAPKILWVRRHEPRTFDKTARVLLPKDEIRRRLTGEFATDVSDASGMLLLDVVRRRWSTQLLADLDLDQSLLAECFESHEVTGRLTRTAARTLGLSTECLVVAGAGDCAAGGIGTGVVCRGILAASIGTSGVMFVHSDEPTIDTQGRLHTFCHAVCGKWHMMGVSLTAGGSLEWFGQQMCHDLMQTKRANLYEALAGEAASIPPGSEGLFWLPYLAGERTPHADPDARGCLIGLTLKHTRGHVARAIMEGVCFAMRDSLEIITQLGVPVRQVRVTGGGSKSPLWRELQANVFGRQVVTVNAEEGPAYGAALLAAVGAGAFDDIGQACDATIRPQEATQVSRRQKGRYNQAFPVFQQLYRSLRHDFQKIAEL
jgi:xylulokinase